MIAEYWANGPHTELPPGHWVLFGQFVSRRDNHTVDDDAKMFFALTNAIFDAGIAAWDARRAFDSVRPIQSIPYLFPGQQNQILRLLYVRLRAVQSRTELGDKGSLICVVGWTYPPRLVRLRRR